MNSGHGYSPPHDQLFMSIVPGHHGMLQPPPNMGHPGLPGQPMPPPGGSMTANHLDVHAHLGPHPGGMPAQHTTLAQHGALLHPHDRIRLRACPVPGCDFVTNQGRARLEKHLATHGSEKPFKCEHEGCGKAFKTSEHLKQHARCHATERNFRCARPLCEDHEAFKSLPELRLHESRMHTLDKAEGREMKLKEKVAKMEADAESARKDNATLRKAVELLQATLIAPNVMTETMSPRYAASTSYNDTPPSGRQSMTIGSEEKMSTAKCVSDAISLPRTIALGRSGLASNIS